MPAIEAVKERHPKKKLLAVLPKHKAKRAYDIKQALQWTCKPCAIERLKSTCFNCWYLCAWFGTHLASPVLIPPSLPRRGIHSVFTINNPIADAELIHLWLFSKWKYVDAMTFVCDKSKAFSKHIPNNASSYWTFIFTGKPRSK